MATEPPKVLIFRIEPTPYIVAANREILKRTSVDSSVAFFAMNESQNWGDSTEDLTGEVLNLPGWIEWLLVLKRIVLLRPNVVHVAGWGRAGSIAAIVFGKMMLARVTVESDTWYDGASGFRSLLKRIAFKSLSLLVWKFCPAGERQSRFLIDYGVKRSKIRALGLTVDVAEIQGKVKSLMHDATERERLTIFPESDRRVVLFVGRLEPYKGVSDLIDAWRNIADRLQGYDLLIVGSGSQEEFLKEKASDCQTIHFAGRLSGDDLLKAYASAEVFVAPSHKEPWGLVVNEAFAFGIPTIISDEFGCLDSLAIDGHNVLTFTSKSVDHLERTILRLCEDDTLRDKLSRNSLRTIGDWKLEDQSRGLIEVWTN